MKSVLATAAVLVALAGVAAGQALQPKAKSNLKKAYTKILKDTELDAGILRVQAYLGDTSRPIVHIVIAVRSAAGEALQARTDAQGMATISDLKPKGKYRVEALIKNELYGSAEFTMPEKMGMFISLSPIPPKGARTGDGGRSPAQMHGIVRGEQGDRAGTLTIRVLRGTWNDNASKVKIHLVGYHSSGKITHMTAVTDGGGRARFSNLDRSHNTAYYAFTIMERNNRNAEPLKSKPHEGYDRLTSKTIQLPPKVGGRMIMAASSVKNTDLAWDNNIDLFGDRSWAVPAPGEVMVEINGAGRGLLLELIKVGSEGIEAVAKVSPVTPRARRVKIGRTGVIPMKLPVGSVYVRVTRPEQMMAKNPRPIPTAQVHLIDGATNKRLEGERRGALTIFRDLKPGKIYSWKLTAFGQTFDGKTFEASENRGQFIPISLDFQLTSSYQAVFKGVKGGNDAVYVARARRGGNVFYSRPFQLTPTKGAFTKIDVGKRIRYAFDFRGELDDDRIIFQGHFMLANASWFPYRAKNGQYVFDLPKGFKGETVHGGMSTVIKKLRGKGFVWPGAIPPRGTSFRGAWIMPVKDGAMRFDMDLPNGAVSSKFQLKHVKGMTIKMYGNMKGTERLDRAGNKWFTLTNVSISPGQAIVLDVSGLPRSPSWHKYLRWAAGGVVLSLLIVGLVGVFRSSRREKDPHGQLDLVARREYLLDKLVGLERKHASGDLEAASYARGKRTLIDELERIYQQLDLQQAGAGPATD